MDDPKNHRKGYRIFSIITLTLHAAWYWIAPEIQLRRGHPDEAAWLPLILMPTAILGGLAGIAACILPKRATLIPFLLLCGVHIAVGLGFHPY